MSTSHFAAAGGIELDRDPIGAGTPFAGYLLSAFPDRAGEVAIGPFKAALVWADPLESGVRPHNLYWSDDEYNYALIADRSAVEIVSLGRSMVCQAG